MPELRRDGRRVPADRVAAALPAQHILLVLEPGLVGGGIQRSGHGADVGVRRDGVHRAGGGVLKGLTNNRMTSGFSELTRAQAWSATRSPPGSLQRKTTISRDEQAMPSVGGSLRFGVRTSSGHRALPEVR